MQPPDKRTSPDRPLSKSAQAWLDYMLRGGRPRQMAPWDEYTWFEDTETRDFIASSAGDWELVCERNPRRVAVVIGNGGERTGVMNTTGHVDTVGTTTNLVGVYLDDTGVIGADRDFRYSFGSQPAVGFAGYSLRPYGNPIILLQSQLGPLVQGEIWGYWPSTVWYGIGVTEVVLRDFPAQ